MSSLPARWSLFALLLLASSGCRVGRVASRVPAAAPGSSGRRLADRLAQRPLVFEGVVLHEETAQLTVLHDCNGGREWLVPPRYEYHCLRISVSKLLAGVLPVDTLVVVVNETLTGVRDPRARERARIAFFGDFVCSAGDTAAGRIAVASGLWGHYAYSDFRLNGDVMFGPFPATFSRRDLHRATRRPEQLARARELSPLRTLLLARVSGNITYASWTDSVQIEPLRSLYGAIPGISPLRLAFHAIECGVDISLGDTLVVPLRAGEPEIGHLKPLCLEDLVVRNGFVKQFGCRFERIVDRCYRVTAAGLEARVRPSR